MKKILLFLYYLILRHLPGKPMPGWRMGYFLRRLVVEKLFLKCGRKVEIREGAYFGDGSRLSLGDFSQIGPNCRVLGKVSIGQNVLMGPDCFIDSTSHEFDRVDIPIKYQGARSDAEICIEDNVWVGTKVVILPGSKIGRDSILGAGTVVKGNIAPFSIVIGNPGKVVKSREMI